MRQYMYSLPMLSIGLNGKVFLKENLVGVGQISKTSYFSINAERNSLTVRFFFFFMFGALELCPGSQGLLQLTSVSMLFSPHLLLRLDTASALAWFKAVAISGVLDYLLF